ncbi:putative thiopurine S-methyltransferase-like protein [Dinothrombium tinctorium]|uniref:Putative thiopurine S-methyltransferase-like protein n=1 Tax=Dinothrombium tinctorium TaxID=1965070 RepID=A0A3S3P0K1_9ACAR|nr:putative thiopurine S-methyltransferase-like protein [Dinothrombium tinctorium]
MPNVSSVIIAKQENGGSVKDPHTYAKMWKELWALSDIAWHLKHRNPALVKYDNKLIIGYNPVRILFPFRGKVIDMSHYWKAGHEILKEKLWMMKENLRSAIKYYQWQFFNFESVNPLINGTIDCVWDRGAFGTITEVEQHYLINTMKKLLVPNFRYLLLVTEFDDSQFNRVPYSQPEEKVRNYFG